MKQFLKKLALWIHIYLKPLQDNGVVPSLYRILLKLDARNGSAHVVLNGNSVVAAGLPAWNGIPGLRCIAIPGLKLSGIRANMFAFAAPCKPKVYIFDGGGNDFIAGRDPDEVFLELREAVKEAREALVYSTGVATPTTRRAEIYWINIVPPGPAHAALAVTIAAFNARVSRAGFVRVIDIHSRLAGPDGFLKEEYRAPDQIHNTPLAIEREWLPAISDIIKGAAQ